MKPPTPTPTPTTTTPPLGAESEWQVLRAAALGASAFEVLLARVSHPEAAEGLLAAAAADDAVIGGCPELASALFGNPRASMTVANRALLTCARAGVTPPDFVGFDELVAQIELDERANCDAVTRDQAFAQLLAADVEVDAVATSPDEAAKEMPARRRAAIDFSKLKLFEKVRLATLGNSNCRQVLLRDPNRMVALAAIRSPRLTDGEIVKAAGNRALGEEVIRFIANRKEMVKLYAVKLALVGNPKCGLAVALRLLPSLHAEDIKQLARSKNVPGALSVAAKRLAAARSPQ